MFIASTHLVRSPNCAKILLNGVCGGSASCVKTSLFSCKPFRSFQIYSKRNISIRNRYGRSQIQPSGSSQQTIDSSKLVIGAAAGLGLGSLCLYGLYGGRTSADAGSLSAADLSVAWPDYVRQRIRSTYGYLAGSAVIAAGSAAALFRSQVAHRLLLSGGLAAPIVMMIACAGTGIVCRSMPYPEDGSLSAKHIAWAIYSTSLGAMLLPVCLAGGPIIARAVVYTGGIVGGLSLVASTAPSKQFLNWGGPLSIGLGVLCVSSLGSMFLSPASRIGSGMAVFSLYGGLLLFSGFILYDTQKVINRAQSIPPPFHNAITSLPHAYMDRHKHTFDPINGSMSILMDAVNIFVRMVAILSGNQRRK